MRIVISRIGICLAFLVLTHGAWADSTSSPKVDQAGAEFFEANIRPLLVANCIRCHGSAKQEAGLRFNDRQEFLKGADSGPIVVGNDPNKSMLMEVVGFAGDTKMPPTGKLPATEIDKLKRWIAMGAPWPDTAKLSGSGASTVQPFDLAKRKASHWAWKPIVKVDPPKSNDSTWAKTPIDRFILAKLEQAGLHPAPAADRHTLCRRIYFDLIGLPPSPAELATFVDDASPDAYEKLVDRLLASPYFGEKWARHWMDLVHYAETRGHEFDYAIPNAWQYRDYLIRAFNADVPYDQFLMEHIAGDLLEHPRLNPANGANESVLATGFWYLGEEVHSPVDIRQDETDRMATRVDTMSKTFLGLTVACARCHDHKFDAISQKDFYALSGFLISSTYRQVCFESMEANRTVAEKLAGLERRAGRELLKRIADVDQPGVDQMADYLMAAREAMLAGVKSAVGSESPGDPIAGIAAKHRLDRHRLSAWLGALFQAQHKPRDLLHAFALKLNGAIAKPQAADESMRVVIDFAKARPDQWFADGVAFGLGPRLPGDVVLGDSAHPIAEVISLGAAYRDAFWIGQKLAEGTQRDPGELESWYRSGRVVRTPKVTLQSGRLFYLVRGAGRAYASVDSYLMLAGPLHGRVLKTWNHAKDGWKWIEHDLTPYKGHRVEVEFSPTSDDEPLAIAMVVEAERAPPLPHAQNGLSLSNILQDNPTSPVALAQVYQHVCQNVLRSLRDGLFTSDKASTATDAENAEVVNWIVQNPGLFANTPSTVNQDLAAVAKSFFDERAALVKQIKTESHTAPALLEGNGVDENLLKRGSPKLAEAEVPRRFLEALGGSPPGGYGPGSGRLVLARQMLQADNPFTARVMVNRLWHHLFGRGIVPTVDNFGVLGQLPSHPELLDYLAEEFRTSDRWSMKTMIRALVLSNTYRMSSAIDPSAEQRDPQNLLLHRMPVRRLSAEAIRDSILAVSQRLDHAQFGPSVETYITAYMDGRGRPGSGPLDGDGRRSIYLKVRRNFLSPMMLAYDMPIPFATVGRRNDSNVPAQALILMNDPFVVAEAKRWAEHEGRSDKNPSRPKPQARVEDMYLTAFARQPTAEETAEALEFLDMMGKSSGLPQTAWRTNEASWAEYAHVLFNVKEFVFLR